MTKKFILLKEFLVELLVSFSYKNWMMDKISRAGLM